MGVRHYPGTTSVSPGGRLDLHLADDGSGTDATVRVSDLVSGATVRTLSVHVDPHPTPEDPTSDHGWPVQARIAVGTDWPSAVYAVDVSPSDDPTRDRALFVVRAATPGQAAPILVAVPFPTFHAYGHMGTPGASLYFNEEPERAGRVSLRRPCPVGIDWEEPLLRWFAESGPPAEYCSGYDLADGLELLGRYRLLVCIGHDEYWSAGMRNTVQEFVAAGGNVAFLTGNTCWWQFRLEDDGATFVCHRDALDDPLTGERNELVTVEWGSAPVDRPENHLLGVSFRRGAGCWNDLAAMAGVAWTTRFADHWVFAGTGLADGAEFGVGTVGYETDAAETVEELGIPRVTGRDGTPTEFVVLADANLAEWRNVGQGGSATMGVFRSEGGGTVFNAATTGWGAGLHPVPDPVVERITGNVLDRLTGPATGADWEVIGAAEDVTAMVACENRLFAADAGGTLWTRDPVPQNLLWTDAGPAADVRALASPREAIGGDPIGLYAITGGGDLLLRSPAAGSGWTRLRAADGLIALAASFRSFFAVTATDSLVTVSIGDNASPWTRIGDGGGVTVLTNLNGRLFGATSDMLMTRRPKPDDAEWEPVTGLPGPPAGLAGYAGRLYLATADGRLHRRDAVW